MKRAAFVVAWLSCAGCLGGEDGGSSERLSGLGESCARTADCVEGAICVDLRCEAPPDAAFDASRPEPDGPVDCPPDECEGDDMCERGEVCEEAREDARGCRVAACERIPCSAINDCPGSRRTCLEDTLTCSREECVPGSADPNDPRCAATEVCMPEGAFRYGCVPKASLACPPADCQHFGFSTCCEGTCASECPAEP